MTILDDGVPGMVIVAEGPDAPVLTVAIAGGPKGDPGPKGESADATALVQAHVDSLLPHPAYDDMVDLALIFENGLI